MHKTWKWKLAGALAAVAVAGSAHLANAASCGDSDNNGTIAINDVVLHLRVVSGLDPQGGLCGGAGYANCGNLNGDGAGTGDIVDTVLLLRKASGIANCPSDTCAAKTILAGCPGTANLPNSIAGNLEVPAGCDAHIHGLTFVESGAVLTVDPGAIIKGDVLNPASALIVKTGGRINAVGTAGSPITWTSAATPGSRQRQDWGGVNILGKAPVNQPNITLEGLDPNTPGVIYGGTDPNDFSGCMSYNKIFFSGREFTTDNELNSFTLCGVGRKTQIDHIQAHFGFDDCIEWFGGTVNSSFMVATACGDDGFDTQLGTVGAVQFGLIADEANSIESPGSNGFENDNSEFGATNEPFNNPKYCNITAIGTNYSSANPTVTNSIGVLSRRGNAFTIANSIVTHWRGSGYQLRDATTAQHACKPDHTVRTKSQFCIGGANDDAACTVDSQCPGGQCGPIEQIINSIFGFNTGSALSGDASDDAATCPSAGPCNCSGTEHFAQLLASKGVIHSAAAEIDNIGGHAFPPTGLNPPGGGVAATTPRANCTTLDSSFVNAPYIGAFAPGGSDWTAGWTEYPFN
jgi:hypothetical protein